MPLSLPTALRQFLLLAGYIIGISTSFWLAFQLRFDFDPAPSNTVHLFLFLVSIVCVKLIFLIIFGQFGSLLSYFGFHDLGKLLAVSLAAAFISLVVWFLSKGAYAPPRAVIVTDCLISFLFLCGFRLSLRLLREGYFDRSNNKIRQKRVIVIGAGDVGAALVKDFQMRRGLGTTPMAFFDDNKAKWGTTIHGISVKGAPESIPDFLRLHQFDQVIIAMPKASGRRIREIVSQLNQLHLRFEIVPSYEQLITGKVRISQIRQVEIQDLLGRATVDLQTDRIRDLVYGKVVMVTGAGGSIGSELCRQIAAYIPNQLLMVERSEYLLFQIEQELLDQGIGSLAIPLVADITNKERMSGIFGKFKPTAVFHAAAHKHVPMMEQQPVEAFNNNTLGTQSLANLAVEFRVERFVLISSDKAINPTNVMGATKRMAELYLQAYQCNHNGVTKFMAVRFGNVLGSSGSVIPTFKKQIAAGGPITITHPDVTRYFMTVNEAVGLVLQSATLGEGGEIFVLDMGEPMKIVDLAKQLVELSGLDPEKDIEMKFTGLRPGEKLYEELNHKTENMVVTEHPKIMRFMSKAQSLEQLQTSLAFIQKTAALNNPDQFKLAIKILVPEYKPYLQIE